MKLTPQQFAYAKSQLPNASDQDIINGFEQSDVTPDKIDTVLQALKAQSQAPQAPAEPTQSVTVQGKVPVTDQKIAALPGPQGQAPQATTNQLDTLYQGNGPTAKRLNTSDPDLYNSAAEKEYRAKGGGDPISRLLAGVAATHNGPAAVQANNEYWAGLETARNTGRVKEAQALADKGLTGANAALGQTVSAKVAQDKLEMDKKNFIMDMQVKGLNYDQAAKYWDEVGSKMYDADTPMAKISRDLASKVLGVSEKTLEGMSPIHLKAMVDAAKPTTDLGKQAQEMWQAQYNGETQRLTAHANARLAHGQARSVELGNTLFNNLTSGGQNPPAGVNFSGSAGPLSFAPNALQTGPQQGMAADLNKSQSYIIDMSNGNVPTVLQGAKRALSNTNLGSGNVAQILSKQGILTTTGQQIRNAIIQEGRARGLSEEAATKEADAIFAQPKDSALQRINGMLNNFEITNINRQRMQDAARAGQSGADFSPVVRVGKTKDGRKVYQLANGQVEEAK